MADIIKQIEVEGIKYDLQTDLNEKIMAGEGKNALVFNEGSANADYSIAGGTTDKTLISGIIGNDFIASITQVNPPVANGIASISYGTGTKTNAAGTMAVGVNSQSGAKGYYFTEINGNTLTLSTKQSSTSKPNNIPWTARALGGIIKGDKITVVNGQIYADCAEITNIDKTNGTITVDSLPFTEKGETDTLSPNDYFVCVLDKLDQGEVECGFGAYTYGYENKAAGILSMAFGSENKTIGSASFVTGRENVAGGFTSLVGGYQNKVLGSSGFATGQNNTVDGVGSGSIGYNNTIAKQQGFAAGANNVIDEACSVTLGSSNHITTKFGFAANINNQVRANCATALGHYSITAKQFDDSGNQISGAPGYAQVVLGRYNAYENGEIDNALLVVGNGSDGARSNAFIVRKTGDAEVKNNLYVSSIIQAQQFNLLGSLTLSQLSTGPRIKINNSNNYLNFVNVDGVSMMHIFGNSIDSTSMTPESILTIGPNYSSGFRFETAKTSSGGVGMYATLGGRKSNDTDTFGIASLSIGAYSKACGVNSVAIGYGAKTNALSQLAIGRWNELDSDALFIIGNGSGDAEQEQRATVFKVDRNGNLFSGSTLFLGKDQDVNEYGGSSICFRNGLEIIQTSSRSLYFSAPESENGYCDLKGLDNIYFGQDGEGCIYNVNTFNFSNGSSIYESWNDGICIYGAYGGRFEVDGSMIISSDMDMNINASQIELQSTDYIKLNSSQIELQSTNYIKLNSSQIQIVDGPINLTASGSYLQNYGANSISSKNNLTIGNGNTSSGANSFVCGLKNTHKSMMGLTMGYGNTNSQSNRGYVIGVNLVLDDNENPDASPRFVFGKNNDTVNQDDLFILGNGKTSSSRSNAFVVDYSGNVNISGGLEIQGGQTFYDEEIGGTLNIVYSHGDTLEFSEDVANEGIILRGLKNISGNLDDSDAATVGYVKSLIGGTKILTISQDDPGSSDIEHVDYSPLEILELVQEGYVVFLDYHGSSLYSLDKIDMNRLEADFGPYYVNSSYELWSR